MSLGKERRTQPKRSTKTIHAERRQFLKVAAIGGGVTCIATTGIGLFLLSQRSQEDGLSNADLLWNEVQKRGISVDPHEQNLWANTYENTDTFIENSQMGQALVERRFLDTVSLMNTSYNAYFKNAARTLEEAFRQQQLALLPYDQISPDGRTEGLVVAMGLIDQGTDIRAGFVFYVSEPYVLNDSSGLTLATVIVHEVEHLKQMQYFLAQLPTGMSERDKVDAWGAHQAIRTNAVRNEAAAYAVQAQAHVQQIGLLGRIFGGLENRNNQITAFYRLGTDPNSPEWFNLIDRVLPTYMTDPNYRPPTPRP